MLAWQLLAEAASPVTLQSCCCRQRVRLPVSLVATTRALEGMEAGRQPVARQISLLGQVASSLQRPRSCSTVHTAAAVCLHQLAHH